MSGSGNPNIPQGTLNRLRGSVVIPLFPALNITAPYLGKEAISINFNSGITDFIETLTGAVTSLAPYQMCEVEVHLLKSQTLATQYKAQIETGALLGDITIIPDTTTLPSYTFNNSAIKDLRPLKFSGMDAGFVVLMAGFYQINSSLWNLQ